MKAKYLKPIIKDVDLYDEDLMLSVSDGAGKALVEDGGYTSNDGITEGDSRRNLLWDEE